MRSDDTPPHLESIHTIVAVSRRPGGWAVLIGDRCAPLFLTAAELARPPAAGDRVRRFRDGRVELIEDPH